MDDERTSAQYLAAGSYIDLILAAVIMQICFIITAIWVGTTGDESLFTNSEHIRHALRIQLGLGWMMCIICGLGFSILPLIYDIKVFDKSLMRSYVGMNMLGQLCIMAGIMIGNEEIFYSMATIGITLLSTSLFILGSPALKIFKSRSVDSKRLGPFSYSIGMILPMLGLITLVSWVARDNEISIYLSEAIIFDLFIPLAVISTIISHFNRRLNWELINSKHIGKTFAALLILMLLSVISIPLYENGDISKRVYSSLAMFHFLFIYIALNPKKIIDKVVEGQPHNKMVLASVFWLPVMGLSAYLEKMELVVTTDGMMSFYRWILIFGFAMQALWGFANYLHDDHKRLSLHRRKTTWLIFISLNFGCIITTFSMIKSWYTGESITQYPRLGVAIFALSYFLILLHWIKQVIFSLDDWHKTPMFYDQYLEYPEQGPGFSTDD
jgi:hypothetical protein